MKKIILLSSMLVTVAMASAQQIDLVRNGLRAEDELQKERLDPQTFSTDADGGVWSLAGAEVLGTFAGMQSVAGDSVAATGRDGISYYRQSADGVSIVGTEDCLTLLHYDLPEQWLRFPMALGDSIGGYANATGRYCDRLFVRRFGTYATRADMTGALVLPQGDTQRNVLRLHTRRQVSRITVPIDTMRHTIPAFTADSIRLHQATDSLIVIEDCYRWYAPGCRYPVLEASQSRLGSRLLSAALCYYPQEAEEQAQQARTAPRLLPGGDALAGAPGDAPSTAAAFTARQSADGQSVVVACTPVRDAQVQALLAGAQGFVLRTTSQTVRAGEPCTLTLGCAGLRPGQYIVYLEVDGERQSQKVSIR